MVTNSQAVCSLSTRYQGVQGSNPWRSTKCLRREYTSLFFIFLIKSQDSIYLNYLIKLIYFCLKSFLLLICIFGTKNISKLAIVIAIIGKKFWLITKFVIPMIAPIITLTYLSFNCQHIHNLCMHSQPYFLCIAKIVVNILTIEGNRYNEIT